MYKRQILYFEVLRSKKLKNVRVKNVPISRTHHTKRILMELPLAKTTSMVGCTKVVVSLASTTRLTTRVWGKATYRVEGWLT